MSTICSACGAGLPPGAANCPNCNLPITAFAVPLPSKQPRTINLLPYLLVLLALAFWGLSAISDKEVKRDSDARDQLHAELNGGTLSTPQNFQDHCGKANQQRRGPDGVILDYGETLVYFESTPAPKARLVDAGNHITLDDQMGMERFTCK